LILHFKGIGSDPVELIDKGQDGHLVSFELFINGQGLGLDSSDRTEDQNGSVQHPERALYLYCKIHMARSIDDINGMILPADIGRSRGDGDAAFSLEFHKIHRGSAAFFTFNFMHAVNFFTVIEYPFGKSCLARINMGTDPDISHPA